MAGRAVSKSYWIVVADSSHAVVYTRRTRRGPLLELRRFENAEAKKKNSELIADRGGRTFDSHGYGRHTITNEKSGPRREQAAAFAKTIADQIIRAWKKGEIRELYLVAAPAFLGYLRESLAAAPEVKVEASFDRSLVNEPVDVIDAVLVND